MVFRLVFLAYEPTLICMECMPLGGMKLGPIV